MAGLLRRAALFGIFGMVVFGSARTARGLEVKVSAMALERTLRAQLFNGPDGRYYMRGDATTECYVYADRPHVTFKDGCIVVHVPTRAKLGAVVRDGCIGYRWRRTPTIACAGSGGRNGRMSRRED